MRWKEKRTHDWEGTFGAFALLVPAVNAAVGHNWLPTMITLLAAILVCCWKTSLDGWLPGWLRGLRIGVIALTLAAILPETYQSWQTGWAQVLIPPVLLALAVYAVGMGRKGAAIGCNVLRYGVCLILAVEFLVSLRLLGWRELRPAAERQALNC